MIIQDDSMPLVSIITPVYNYKNYINQCSLIIETLSCQKIELIVVNGGSADETQSIHNDIYSNKLFITIIGSLKKDLSRKMYINPLAGFSLLVIFKLLYKLGCEN